MLEPQPDFAAAEAEAAMSATETEDAVEDPAQEIPTIAEEVVAARLAGLVPPSDAGEPSERLTTKVVVSGLVSVASIAAFKRGVARTQGVASVGVTSGPDGEFVFMVSHSPSSRPQGGHRRPARVRCPRDRRIGGRLRRLRARPRSAD